MNRILSSLLACMAICLPLMAQTGHETGFQKWALTPPMGWNSWDCYGPTVVESEVKANADYMAEKLAPFGWEYVVVDIRWFVENDKAGGYNQTDPRYVVDEYGRYTPALNRFPSAADGKGFKPLADYIHSKKLKFGIHIMRGLPKVAADRKLPVLGTNGITCDMIASNDSACTWLRDNYKVDWRKPGAQEYYNSIFNLYAQWGVDFIKIDDLSRPYHTAEIEMIRRAIDQCGRPIVLSMSPGETPLDRVDHVKSHANMWRTVDDFWDNWSQLNYQFGICAKWAPHSAPGTWPDADMLPLGKISIRGERGAERYSNFTRDEQYTLMNLWTIFRSPLMFGGDLPQNDEFTNSLLTNRDVLYMHSYSAGNRQLGSEGGHIVWTSDDPANGDRFAALFNTGGSEWINTSGYLWRSGTISYLTTGYATAVDFDIPENATQLCLVVTDGGDGFDSDHADWINPVITLKNGTKVDLTELPYLKATCGWGNVAVNRNLNGGKLKIDGHEYDKGIATHANSILIYDLPEGASRFSAIAGIDNTGTDQGSKSSVEFLAFTDDPTYRSETTDANAGSKTLNVDPSLQVASSGYVCRASNVHPRTVEADITGAERLWLVVTNGGDNFDYDHADWVNPVLIDANGNETSLTEIPWDENPINGWNAPRLNRNNDGGTLRLGDTDYDKGFGVNAPSQLVFTLPAGHKYTKFKALVGYDAGVANAPHGVTMEFRVFTRDPEPNFTAPVTLDLNALGYAPSQQVRITEMWKGETVGTFADSDFAPVLKSHASGLYRLSAVNRNDGAALTIDADKENINVSLTGASADNAYIRIFCDDSMIGTIPMEGQRSVAFPLKAVPEGIHNIYASYSGNTEWNPAKSQSIQVSGESGILNHAAPAGRLSLSPVQGGLKVNSPEYATLPIYSVAGTLILIAELKPGCQTVSLAPGQYVAAGKTFLVK